LFRLFLFCTLQVLASVVTSRPVEAFMKFVFSVAAMLVAWGATAAAQSSIPNPLRPSAAQPATPAPEAARPAAGDTKAATPKPKRERSAKQKQSDDDMRACGASWRADKDQLKAKGETWRSYLKTCRTARKASRGDA
jgi:hypothetical protein